MNHRGICKIPDCGNLVAFKGFRNGLRQYRTVCQNHRNKRRAGKIDQSACVACGWEGSCDRHRIKPGKYGGHYFASNVLVLCPNCHRAAHGQGQWNKPGITLEALLKQKKERDAPLLSRAS